MDQYNESKYQSIGKQNDHQRQVPIEHYELTNRALQRRATGRDSLMDEADDRAESIEEDEDWQAVWRRWKEDPDDTDLSRVLRNIANRLSNGNLIIDTDEDLDRFATDDKGEMFYIGCSVDEKANMLHLMASSTENTYLVRYLVEMMPSLMLEKDGYSFWPLHVAINENNPSFISAVLDITFSPEDMKTVLAERVGNERMNCIHIAIKGGLNTKQVITLIGKSNEEILAQKDGAGLTPLHYAVDYKNCKKGQYEVFRALLERGDAALDMEGGGGVSLSPFRYHEETKRVEKSGIRELEREKHQALGRSRKEAYSTYRQQKFTKRGDDNTHVRLDDLDTRWGKHRVMKEVERSTPGEETKSETEERNRLIDKTTPAIVVHKEAERSNQRRPSSAVQIETVASQKVSQTAERPTAANKATKITAGAAATRRKGGSHTKSSASRKPRPAKELPDEVTANKIAKELKLHYLRSIFKTSTESGMRETVKGQRKEPRNHDSAVRYLYGDNKQSMKAFINPFYYCSFKLISHSIDHHICFDYLNGPAKINTDKFETTYNGFEFDEVLQYVAFRRTEFMEPDLPPRPNERTRKVPTGKGRKDMEAPFRWLTNKGVRNIIKVIVDDLEMPSHKDESIVKALKDFNIEILDWRKIDLCPEAICSSCPNLREVHLWWSGNNGILRAWSEPEGLIRLRKLEAIYVHQVQVSS